MQKAAVMLVNPFTVLSQYDVALKNGAKAVI
jgi:flagellar assembly factor FliW